MIENHLKIHLSTVKKAGSANIYDVIKAVFGANHVPVYSKTTPDWNQLYRVEFQKQKNSAHILKILKNSVGLGSDPNLRLRSRIWDYYGLDTFDETVLINDAYCFFYLNLCCSIFFTVYMFTAYWLMLRVALPSW